MNNNTTNLTKITSILLTLTLSAGLFSCTKEDKPTPDSTAPVTNIDEPHADESTTESETTPETEPFDMPPETNELVVYSNSMTRSVLTAAVNFFKDQYPDVDVTYTNISDESYDDLLKTELAAGAGPDIVYSLDIDINDVYKLMMSSIFMNLDGFLNSDDSFNIDDYIPGVFNSGVLNGRRYFVPIDFTAHSALTTQEILDEEGLMLDEIKTFDGYIDSIYNYNQKYSEDPDKGAIYWNATNPDSFETNHLINSFGSTYIDYENNKVTINGTEKDDFRELMDGIRKIFGMPVVDSFNPGSDFNGLINHKCLYSGIDISLKMIVPMFTASIIDAGKTPVVFIPQNPAGETSGHINSFAAIPEGAKNKLNAYRFMQILLSDELQSGEGDRMGTRVEYLNYSPVKKDAVYKHITSWVLDPNNPDYVNAVEMCAEVMVNVDNAVLVPSQVKQYIVDEMNPYFTGRKDWDECYDRLVNVLELYKDE